LSTTSKGPGSSSRSVRSAIPYSYDARDDLVRHTPLPAATAPVPAPVASPARVPSTRPPSPSRAAEPGAARADLGGGLGRGLRPRRPARAKRKRQAVRPRESLSATKNRLALESPTTLNRASSPRKTSGTAPARFGSRYSGRLTVTPAPQNEERQGSQSFHPIRNRTGW
jgi:hypothetical protein